VYTTSSSLFHKANPSKDHLSALVFGAGTFVTVGTWGQIGASSNGTTWTMPNDGTTSGLYSGWGDAPELNAVTFGGGRFIAAGQWGETAWSTDGTTWTRVLNTSFANRDILGIAYGDSKFFAVGNEGRVAWSSNGGDWSNWVSDNLFGDSSAINAITYGDSKFVAVSSSGRIKYSSNGTSWTEAASPFQGTGILGIAHNGSSGAGSKFIAVGHNGKMAESTDGITWIAIPVGTEAGQTMFTGNEQIRALAYGNTKFVAGGNDYGSNNVLGASKMAYSN
jgi:hypothetical protein